MESDAPGFLKELPLPPIIHQTTHIMKHLIHLLLALPLLAAEPNTLTPEEKKDGWQLLFNGSDLEGWRMYASAKKPLPGWQVADGVLTKKRRIPGGNIITVGKFTDYELSWEWKIAENGNNGIKYLVTEERKSAPGPEYQILDDNGHPDGKVGPKRQTACLYDILPPAPDKPLKAPGEWNHSRIIIQGNLVEHWLNGAKVLSYELGSPELLDAISKSKFKNHKDFGTKIEGHIMLTDHSDECSFRNIKLRPLNGG